LKGTVRMATQDSANVGRAVATRVGANIREIRTRLGLTQSSLASPEFSISYISAIERGKIRPSLRAIALLAKRLDVPLAFLLEGSPSDTAEARAIGYSPADSGPDQRLEVELLQASVLVQQQRYQEAAELLAPLQVERMTTDQVYRLFVLRGHIHLGLHEHQEAVVDLRAAVTQAERMKDLAYSERTRNLLGKAYFLLDNYTLAQENHLRCATAIEDGQVPDPLFALAVYTNLADDYSMQGKGEHAVALYHKALGALEAVKRDDRGFAAVYMQIGRNYKSLGKQTMARDYLQRSLALSWMRDTQRLDGLTHHCLAKALEESGDVDGAEKQERLAIAIEQDIEDAIAASTSHASLAALLLKRGSVDEAEQEAQEALAFANASQDAQTRGQALMALGQVRHHTKDYTGTDRLFAEALGVLDAEAVHERAAEAYFRYATLLEERGEGQRSLAAFKKALEHQRQGESG
jgi:HTH-type transcriptional regulator, quorum sensing regulator NprR